MKPRKQRPKYVPPMDKKEQHLPGMNYAGPGTNVEKRQRLGVQPMDALDRAALNHDLVTEPRGPFLSNGKVRALRTADQKLMNKANSLVRAGYRPKWKAELVARSMKMLLITGARGRR